MTSQNLVSTFKQSAGLVSAFIYDTATLEGAFRQAVDICSAKSPCQSQLAPEGSSPSASAKKIIAAPNLADDEAAQLESLCKEAGITLIRSGMREHPGGIDMGLTKIDLGIAETGTLVLNSDSEETRLATMLSEFHVAILRTSDIRPDALSMADDLKAMTGRPSSYTAFITGASRTADIERVLALGVHGPLELHIMLLE